MTKAHKCVSHPINPADWSIEAVKLAGLSPGAKSMKDNVKVIDGIYVTEAPEKGSGNTPNSPSQLNNSLLSLQFDDGYFSDGSFHENPIVRNKKPSGQSIQSKWPGKYFVVVVPAVLQLTENNVDLFGNGPLQAWLNAQRSKRKLFTFVWRALGFEVTKSNLSSLSGDVFDKVGRPVRDDKSDFRPKVLLVASVPTAKRFRTALNQNGFQVSNLELSCGASHVYTKSQVSDLVFVWIDGDISDGLLTAVGLGAQRTNNLLVGCTSSDRLACDRAEKFLGEFRLDTQTHMFKSDLAPGRNPTLIVGKLRSVLNRERGLERSQADLLDELKERCADLGSLVPTADPGLFKTRVLETLATLHLQFKTKEHEEGPTSEGYVREVRGLMHKADEIYAVNSLHNSQFWGSEVFYTYKNDYLPRVPTLRLFVFNSPEALLASVTILNEQAAHYGGKASLFVTDSHHFESLFGKPEEDIAYVHKGQKWYRLALKPKGFRIVEDVDPSKEEMLQKLTTLNKCVFNGNLCIDQSENLRFVKWSSNFQAEPGFPEAVNYIFKNSRRAGCHVVLRLRGDSRIPSEEFEKNVLRVEATMGANLERFRAYHLTSIDSGFDRGGSGRIDGHYTPLTESEAGLIMHFEKKERLEDFFRCRELDQIRRRFHRDIFSAIGVRQVDNLCDSIGDLGSRYWTYSIYDESHNINEWLRAQRGILGTMGTGQAGAL